jgi:hypothetical protein
MNTNRFLRLCFQIYQIISFSVHLHNILGIHPLFFSPFYKKMSIYHQIFFDIVYTADREERLTLELLKLELKKLDVVEKFLSKIYTI